MRLLKKLLWRLTRRDFLILNPTWQWFDSAKDVRVIGQVLPDSPRNILPVQYSYHLLPSGCLKYFVFGSGSGVLHYDLTFSSGIKIASFSWPVKLPYQLSVVLSQDQITANGQCISTNGVDLSNPPSIDLTGLITFASPGRLGQIRRTHHRMRFPSAEVDEGYFTGRHYADYEQELKDSHYSHILGVLASFEELVGKFIDVGCAHGGLVHAALRVGLDAYGIDYSAWVIDQASSHLGKRVKRADMDKASANELGQGYQFVTAIAVLEHLKFPDKALSTLYDICAPGGIVYLETLNNRSLLSGALGDDWAGYTDYNHFSAWINWAWLRDMAQKVGFEIECLETSTFWADRDRDSVWCQAGRLFETNVLTALLADGYGDIVQAVLRRPRDRTNVDSNADSLS